MGMAAPVTFQTDKPEVSSSTDPLADKFGRKWAHRDTLKEGDRVQADGGFTCIESGAILPVQCDITREGFDGFYIACSDGRHYLDGQLGDHGELVGLYQV